MRDVYTFKCDAMYVKIYSLILKGPTIDVCNSPKLEKVTLVGEYYL
jgi:hypothetical protein